MSELVRFRSVEGEEVLVEVDEQQFGTERVARDAQGVAEAADTLDAALHRTMPALRRLAASVRAIAPDGHEIEFGIKLNAEAGAIIAKTSAEGHFSVRMSWRSRTDT